MEICGYEIDIDLVRTKELYKKKKTISEECGCETCKMLNIEIIERFKELHEEFEQYNIELNKSEDICELESNSSKRVYLGIYHIVGKLNNNRDCWKLVGKENLLVIDEESMIPFKLGKYGFTNKISLKKDYEPNDIVQMELILILDNTKKKFA
jgi:hypothetical protein